jgi:ATP-dependent DNA helicase RecG
MTIPSWANPEITALLPKIRGEGESQANEFKEDFPAQAHELAKEVAAFATAGGGMILIGVHDDGTVAGLSDVDTDGLYHRAQRISEQVSPAVKHRVSLCHDGGIVLVICIEKDQNEPVFYYDGRPYIRVGRTSRPASPDEVKAKVLAHPSAEQKKRMEDLNYEIARGFVEQSAKRTAEADAIALRAMAAQNETLASIGRQFLRNG